MKTFLFVVGCLSLIVAFAMELFPDRRYSSLPFWIICSINLSGYAVCDYLHKILHAVVYLANEKSKEVRRRDED